MPSFPEHQHFCVCGWGGASFANLVVHRRTCDSWQEHREKVSAARQQPPAPVENVNEAECPYCHATLGNVSFVLAHLPKCDHRVGAFEDAFVHSKALARFHERIAIELAFEDYCREHPREP